MSEVKLDYDFFMGCSEPYGELSFYTVCVIRRYKDGTCYVEYAAKSKTEEEFDTDVDMIATQYNIPDERIKRFK